MNMGTPGTVLPSGQFVPNMNMPGTPGIVLPGGQFVPSIAMNSSAAVPGTPGAAMNLATPGTAILPNGQVVPVPAPGPVISREQQQFVGPPPGERADMVSNCL